MNRLKDLRKEKGLTQAELAEKVGTTQATLSSWENERFSIASNYIPVFCKFFNCSADYLLGTDEPDQLLNNDPELTEYLEELKNNPEMRMLFRVTKGATKEDFEKAVAIIKALLKKE